MTHTLTFSEEKRGQRVWSVWVRERKSDKMGKCTNVVCNLLEWAFHTGVHSTVLVIATFQISCEIRATRNSEADLHLKNYNTWLNGIEYWNTALIVTILSHYIICVWFLKNFVLIECDHSFECDHSERSNQGNSGGEGIFPLFHNGTD